MAGKELGERLGGLAGELLPGGPFLPTDLHDFSRHGVVKKEVVPAGRFDYVAKLAVNNVAGRLASPGLLRAGIAFSDDGHGKCLRCFLGMIGCQKQMFLTFPK